MATYLEPKVPAEVVRRTWTIPVDADDAPSSVSLSATGITVDANSFEGNDLVLTLSAGTAAATGSIVATVTTDKSRTLVETLYIPIVESAAQVADTARDYVNFALRKVTGLGNDPTADEASDALERLNALIAVWREGGAEIASPYPLALNSVIYCPDWAVMGLRYNLLAECCEFYGVQMTASEAMGARKGLQLIKHKNLPESRKVEFY